MAKEKETPAFQFYPDDFLGGTQDFTASEVGGYIRLLIYQWKNGSVPGDKLGRLATIMGMSQSSARSAWQVIGAKFRQGEDEQWRNEKMEKVRVGKMKFIESRSANGTKGAAARWKNGTVDGTSDGTSDGTEDGSLSLPSPRDESQNDSSRPPKDLLAVHQALFIAKYGRKPAYDGAKDAAIAQRLIRKHGFDGASELLETYFESTDPWLSKTGHGMGPLGSATTINKLIAESEARSRANLRAVATQKPPCPECGDSGWVQGMDDPAPRRCPCRIARKASA